METNYESVKREAELILKVCMYIYKFKIIKSLIVQISGGGRVAIIRLDHGICTAIQMNLAPTYYNNIATHL